MTNLKSNKKGNTTSDHHHAFEKSVLNFLLKVLLRSDQSPLVITLGKFYLNFKERAIFFANKLSNLLYYYMALYEMGMKNTLD